MKMEITSEAALELINEIRRQPENLFEMIRADFNRTWADTFPNSWMWN